MCRRIVSTAPDPHNTRGFVGARIVRVEQSAKLARRVAQYHLIR
jgi:hypothetical protein